MSRALYIVTGAAGHLGVNVVRELLSKGHKVRALVLPHESCLPHVDQNIHLLREYTGNVCDPASLEPLFHHETDEEVIVIHCAGIVSISSVKSQRVYDVNVGGVKNIIAACQTFGVKRLVYVSSVHAIPMSKHGIVMAEVPRFDPTAVIGWYAKTKAIATQLVLDAAQSGLDAVVVHPSGIIGPYGLPTGNMSQLVNSFLDGKFSVAIRGAYDFVDVRDVAEGILAAAEKGSSGECYILSNRLFTIREILDTLAEISGLKKVKIYLPMWLAKSFAPFAELHYLVWGKTPLFTIYSLYTLSHNSLFSHAKASRELGYSARPLKETLADTARLHLE